MFSLHRLRAAGPTFSVVLQRCDDQTLQAAMLFAKAEFLPDLRSNTFDEVLAIVGPEGERDS
jgi:hypothetical protein